jgi:hypothetical protein
MTNYRNHCYSVCLGKTVMPLSKNCHEVKENESMLGCQQALNQSEFLSSTSSSVSKSATLKTTPSLTLLYPLHCPWEKSVTQLSFGVEATKGFDS